MKSETQFCEQILKETLAAYKDGFNETNKEYGITTDFTLTVTAHRQNPRKVAEAHIDKEIRNLEQYAIGDSPEAERAREELKSLEQRKKSIVSRYVNKFLDLRYMRLVRTETRITYRPAEEKEFVPGFQVEVFNKELNSWVPTVWPMAEVPDNLENYRVKKPIYKEYPLHTAEYTFKDKKELVNKDKWMKALYLNVISRLMGGGIEYGEAIWQMDQKAKEEAYVKAQVMDEAAKNNQQSKSEMEVEGLGVVRALNATMPMSKSDEEYKKWLKAEREKEGIDDKGMPIKK